MMREIKFRFWDKSCNYMDYEPNDVYVDGFGDPYEMESTTEQGEPWQEMKYQSDYVVMQYTGLTDKNGVEIYEGDILSIDDRLNTRFWVAFEIDSYVTKIEYNGNYTAMSGYENDLLSHNNKISEVIGNIYQHPHLLKEDIQ